MNKKIIKALLVLSILGIAASGFLLYQHYQIATKGFGEKSFCSINEVINCDIVNASSYSEILSVPVSGLALLYYALVAFYLIAALFSEPNQKGGLAYNLLLSLPALAMTLGMNYISIFKIKVICLVCIFMSILVLLLCILLPVALKVRFGQIGSFMTTYVKELFKEKNSLGFTPRFMTHSATTLLVFAIGSILMLKSGSADSDTAAKADRYVQIHFSQPVTPLTLTDQPVWGNKDAAVKIVEFSDFQCPYCRLAALNLKPALTEYKDRIALYFVNYPLDSACNPAMKQPMHAFACSAAKASLCAAQQGKFWPYHDKLFDNQKKLSEDYLLDYAEKLKLDRNAMTECMRSDAIKNRLDADLALANLVGVQGTPTIVVNGRKLGPWSNTKILRAVIEQELSNAATPKK